MRLIALGSLVFASVLASACSSSPMASPTSPSTSASTSSTMAALSGTWASSAATSGTSAGTGGCSHVQFTVTPVGSDRATVTYGATCMGIVIRGTGDGVASGNSATWNTAGSAGPCAFSLNGTATPVSSSSARMTYTGTVCGMPVSGSEVLTR